MYCCRAKTPRAYSSLMPVPVSPASVMRRSAYSARLARSAGHSWSTTGFGARVPWRDTTCTATNVLFPLASAPSGFGAAAAASSAPPRDRSASVCSVALPECDCTATVADRATMAASNRRIILRGCMARSSGGRRWAAALTSSVAEREATRRTADRPQDKRGNSENRRRVVNTAHATTRRRVRRAGRRTNEQSIRRSRQPLAHSSSQSQDTAMWAGSYDALRCGR